MTAQTTSKPSENSDLSRRSISFPDGAQSVLRSSAPANAPRIVFCHATGFNAGAYRRLLSPLAADAQILAPDQRGHGFSTLVADPQRLKSFQQYADDLIRLLERERFGPALLAGHSLGATVSLLAAAKRPDLATGLVMIEPVLVPATLRWITRTPLWLVMRERLGIRRSALNRRSRWSDRAEVIASYADKPFFASWSEGVLDDYLDGGLIEDEEGVRLACAPAWEGATFAAMGHDLWGAVRRLKTPSVLVRAGRGSTAPSFFVRRFERMQPEARVIKMSDAGHLIPMEQPGACREVIAEALSNGWGAG